MNNNPKVTILMPVHNGEATIKKAIKSTLKQSFQNFEFIIIDDGSTDNTANIVKKNAETNKKIIYIKNETNLGIQKSLNKGLKIATGKYIARIDDDDEWCENDKLKKQVEFLDNNSNYAIVGTGIIVVNENSKELFRFLNPTEDVIIRKKILSANCFSHPSVLMRKSMLLAVNGYSETNKCFYVEDYDLWLKLGTVGKFANLSIFGLKYTISKNQISTLHKIKQLKTNFYLIKKYKKFYPHYYIALLRACLRLLVYGYFNFQYLSKITAKFKQ
ncbi:MAG: glycosyltransferase family 2 protein [Candidatus Falkowbacteria bacterium]